MGLAEIVLMLKPVLQAKPYVHAMWLEGSYASGQFRADSDVDVWLDVDKDQFKQACDDFENALKAMSMLRSAGAQLLQWERT